MGRSQQVEERLVTQDGLGSEEMCHQFLVWFIFMTCSPHNYEIMMETTD